MKKERLRNTPVAKYVKSKLKGRRVVDLVLETDGTVYSDKDPLKDDVVSRDSSVVYEVVTLKTSNGFFDSFDVVEWFYDASARRARKLESSFDDVHEAASYIEHVLEDFAE